MRTRAQLRRLANAEMGLVCFRIATMTALAAALLYAVLNLPPA